jgi:hypothetical protein
MPPPLIVDVWRLFLEPVASSRAVTDWFHSFASHLAGLESIASRIRDVEARRAALLDIPEELKFIGPFPSELTSAPPTVASFKDPSSSTISNVRAGSASAAQVAALLIQHLGDGSTESSLSDWQVFFHLMEASVEPRTFAALLEVMEALR